jgi:5-methylcytosine-specific restriction endonuclease McrA
MAVVTKRCSKCEIEKAVGEFRKNSRGYGFSSRCKQCLYLYHQSWQKENPECVNTEQIKAYQHRRRKECLEQNRICAQCRRSRKYNLSATLTIVEWQNLLVYYNNQCAYCDRPFSDKCPPVQDHFIPFSKGGEYTKENIVPACQNCNARKHDRVFKDIHEAREWLSGEL